MRKVLVVDDEEDILDIVSIILIRKGYNVITEVDGGKVLNLVEEEKPCLVLIDVNLNPYDGRVICCEIKSKHPIPVILFSANVMNGKNYHHCFADDFIEKPFDIQEIEKVVGKHLKSPLS